MKRMFVVAFVVALSVAVADAGSFKKGDMLWMDLTQQGTAGRQVAMGYIQGVWDTNEQLLNTNRGGMRLCYPDDVTIAKVVDVVEKHLRDNPEDRRFVASGVVMRAIFLAWPCEQER